MSFDDELEPEDLEEVLQGWIDTMMEVYEDIYHEWQSNNIVQPKVIPPEGINFHCTNCGNCCRFDDHWVWVYPSDIKNWMGLLRKEKIAPLLLGILFPVQDNENCIGYGLPSQQIITEKFTEIIKGEKPNSPVRQTLQAILKQLQKVNPSFNKDSEYCIFYNSQKPDGHCLIHHNRPIQCRVYPYDFPQFTKMVIPESLSKKYGAFEDDMDDLPECTKDAFSGDPKLGVQTTASERDWVLHEKANYLMSEVTQEMQDPDLDISELLMELYHPLILTMDREQIHREGDKKEKPIQYVAGKRPQRPNPHQKPQKSPHVPKKSSSSK
jgi:Fe-S-cluster containining protein